MRTCPVNQVPFGSWHSGEFCCDRSYSPSIEFRYTELDGMDELYDLKADPYEIQNLIHDAAAGPELERLRTELQKLLAQTGGLDQGMSDIGNR